MQHDEPFASMHLRTAFTASWCLLGQAASDIENMQDELTVEAHNQSTSQASHFSPSNLFAGPSSHQTRALGISCLQVCQGLPFNII